MDGMCINMTRKKAVAFHTNISHQTFQLPFPIGTNSKSSTLHLRINKCLFSHLPLVFPFPKPQLQRLLNPQCPNPLIPPSVPQFTPRHLHIEVPHHARDNNAHLQQCDFLADAGAGADGEGFVGGGDGGFGSGIGGVGGEEAGGGEEGGVREVEGGVVGGVGVEVAYGLRVGLVGWWERWGVALRWSGCM